jgi:Protein of unknown function, DUF547
LVCALDVPKGDERMIIWVRRRFPELVVLATICVTGLGAMVSTAIAGTFACLTDKPAAEIQEPPPVTTLDATGYDRLLHSYVTENGWVDYAGLARERGVLDQFLQELGKASPSDFKTNQEKLAFWIDSYNAFTLADALDTVYGKQEGVRKVEGFFNGRKHPVAGERLTLDEIEGRGRNLHDPRIHFAIVCASTSCPKLQRFAYTGELLNSQLNLAAREFFADPNRGLRFDPRKNELYVSPILKWYAGDFTGTTGGAGSTWARVKATVSGSELMNFIAKYAPPEVANRIEQNPPTLHYFDYDWSLNSLDTHSSGTKK